MATAEIEVPPNGAPLRPLMDTEAGDEFWDATTSWDMTVEVPARLIEYVDDNVKACKFG